MQITNPEKQKNILSSTNATDYKIIEEKSGVVDRLKTARDWFEQGLQLDDDSKQEIVCYQKALQLDPDFAPAHFRLGAIFMRQAMFEEAELQFALFWSKSTKNEKNSYNINVYTNLETIQAKLRAIQAENKDMQNPEAIIIPYQEAGTQILVNVILNNHIQARMLLDTGADITVISKALTEKAWFPYINSINLHTIAQNKITARVVQASSLQLGRLNKENVKIAVADIPVLNQNAVDGILGMDVLNGMSVQIDRRQQKVILD